MSHHFSGSPWCACRRTCGDVPEGQDDDLAVCKDLPRATEPDGDAGCTCHPPRSAPGIWVAHQPGCPERDRLRALGLDESHEATETTKPLGAFSCCNCQQGWHMTWAGIVNCRRLAATTKTGERPS